MFIAELFESIDPVSGAGAVAPTPTNKTTKEPLVKSAEPAVKVSIKNQQPDPNAQVYTKLKQLVNENQSVSTEAMIDYIRKHHDPNLHSDYTDYITNTFTGFELRDIPVNSIKTDLPKLDPAKVEKYKTMDFSKAPPIVVGAGNILDGYHRANAAKALGIPTIRAYVGVQGVAEGKVKLFTDPGYFGAKIDDTGFDNLPVVNISADRLVGFEPDDKMNQSKSKANVEKIVAGLKQGAKLPPLLVRKYKDGYQVLDGHHRFWAYKLLGTKSIPSRIVPDKDIEEISKQGVAEVTLVPSVAKSKRQHLDVMPNEGHPIPKGDESDYLGDLVAEMGDGYQLWSWKSRWDKTYFVFDTKTRICQLATTGKQYPENPDSFVVVGVYSGPQNQYRAADLYAFLILNQGLTLVSDNKQSAGGYRVWQELEQRYGRKLNIHGFDTRTDEPVNVTTKDEPDTHVDRDTVKRAGPQMKRELGSISRDLRFVASAK